MAETWIINPLTQRQIKIGGPTYQKLINTNILTQNKKIPLIKKSENKVMTMNQDKIPLKKKTIPNSTDIDLKVPIKKKLVPKSMHNTATYSNTTPSNQLGKVRIGQKRRRGVKGDKDASMHNYKNINVTSGSFNIVGGNSAKTLSPMSLGPVIDQNGLKATIFENYWQYGKLWKTAGHITEGTDCQPTESWMQFRNKGYGLSKGKRHPLPVKEYGYPVCSIYNNKVYDYISSRKDIYVPIYKDLIKNLPIIAEMKKLLSQGQNIMIIDVDGPPKDIYPNGLELNADNWDQMINNPKYSFGHGYVVAALISQLIT